MRDIVPRIVYPILVFVVVGSFWQLGAERSLFPAYILPAPSIIALRLSSTTSLMVWHALVTTEEILCGFILAIVVGVCLAWMLAYVRVFEQAFYPWLVFVQVLPKVALGPLLVVWLGVGFLPKVLVSFLLAFFPIMIDTLVGLKSVQRDYVFLLRSMGARPLKRFWYFQLPNALPHIFGSLKVAITLSAVGAIVGEFVGADKGLGYVLIVSTGSLDTVLLFVALVWISILTLVLYGFVCLFERIFVSWHTSLRHNYATDAF
jgi:NitT/TauT family transport system permease protein